MRSKGIHCGLSLLLLVGVVACKAKYEGPEITAMAVTGTDGMPASKSRAAEIAPLQNAGQFKVDYSLDSADGQYVEILVQKNGRSERLDERCCGNTGCPGAASLSCAYNSLNRLVCTSSDSTTPNDIDLSSYFSATGGLPNQSELTIRNCSQTCYNGFEDLFHFGRNKQCQVASLPVVFR